MIDPANYIIRVRDVNANHVVDYGLTKGMLMALSQLGLLNKAPFGVEQPRGEPPLTVSILYSTNFRWGKKYHPDRIKCLEKMHIMPGRWLSFDEVGEGMLWSSKYLVLVRRESGAMILTDKQEKNQNTYVWFKRIGMVGPVECYESIARARELEDSVAAVTWFERAPPALRGWMLGEIAPMIKVKTSLEIV